MNNDFTKKYFEPCVKDFVSTVLLIDDQLVYNEPATFSEIKDETLVIPEQGVTQPYIENTTPVFPVTNKTDDIKRSVYITDLIKNFSNEGLLVTPINPQKLGSQCKDDCIEILLKLAEKSDVIILDWDMNISFSEDEEFSSSELSQKLIERLNVDNKYRLVIIYTADTETNVRSVIPQSENIDVRIYGKTGVTGTNIKTYDELAKQVNVDFLAEKKGLLGAALLTSLTALRKSTYSMLNALNTDYDKALIYHRMLLSNPDKIVDFCRAIINDEIFAHIENFSIEPFFTKTSFKSFIKDNEIKIKKKNNASECEISYDELDKLLDGGFSKAVYEEEIMKSFSYYSTMISGNNKPNLKLGCILKRDEDYYLCIQPPCDSERIDKLDSCGKCNNPQNFLFLKLEKNDKNISLYVKEANSFCGLLLRYKSVETFLVAGNSNGFVSQNENGDYVTYNENGETLKLHYICCLKPMFAQKIANNFAANISRVGIDQFEWLRLKGRE